MITTGPRSPREAVTMGAATPDPTNRSNPYLAKTLGITQQQHYDRDPSAQAALHELSYTQPAEETHPFTRGTVKLEWNWESSGDPLHGVKLHQWPVISLEYNNLTDLETIQDDIRRIEDLVTLCISHATELDRLILQRPDARIRMLSGEELEYEQPIELLMQPLRYVGPDKRKPRHEHQMLLTYKELGGISTIARWLDATETLKHALSQLMSVRHVDQMFAENRFLNVTSAAEAYHRIVHGDTYMPQAEFGELLDVYIRNTPEQHRKWLHGKLDYANDAPLAKRLRKLAAQAGNITKTIVGDRDRWSYTVAQARNSLTHLNNRQNTSSAPDLAYLAESAYAVVRACMLLECGVPIETLTKRADSYEQTWYADRVQHTINRNRAALRNEDE
jgi:hypothetical protein